MRLFLQLLAISGICCWCGTTSALLPQVEEIKHLLPDDLTEETPTVAIALLVRNKEHILPLFLTYLENLDYPKHRISLWIRSDHNTDDSIAILTTWLEHVEPLYHSVNKQLDSSTQRHHQNESSPFDWPQARFQHLIKLKEEAMLYAQKIWADYIFYLDADVLLTAPETLKHLTSLHLPIVAPMLLSEGLYSNFWCGMTPDYYYLRTEEYKEIYNVYKEGIFQVPMIHSALLININYKGSKYLTFDRDNLREQQKTDLDYMSSLGEQCRLYDGPLDDIIVFAISANCSKIPLFISNEFPFGYLLQPLEPSDNIKQDYKQLTNIKANIVHDLGEIRPVNEYLQKFEIKKEKHKLTLDHIYMINLERRTERRQKMESLFNILDLDVEYFPAVDGKKLNPEAIQEMGIKYLPSYEDPYHHRPMTMGEIGCFLSHYRIWEKIVEKQLKEVLILEDDIRFEPYFNEKAESVLDQIRNVVEYDLVYFGRKRLKDEIEPWVDNTESLVYAGYSYWTLGYVITLQGAEKLLAAKPLEKLLPVDEFLPIMFNRHPNRTWAAAFPKRDVLAFSAAPLLLYPTHYTGDVGYISDTEDSILVNENDDEQRSYYSHEQGGAELKSDREKEFMVLPKLNKPVQLIDPPELQMKSHEEL